MGAQHTLGHTSNFRILIDRIEEAGVSFKRRPFRLHHQWHGQLRDTFFVWEDFSSRTPLCTTVDWTFEGQGRRACGCEAAISRFGATSLYRFVRGPLYLMKDHHGSGYGLMLVVSETPPDQWHAADLLAALKPNSAPDDRSLLHEANSRYSGVQLEEIEHAAIAKARGEA